MTEYNFPTWWGQLMTVLRWGKWVLGVLALNAADAMIETGFWIVVAVLVAAVIGDRLRTRWLLRRWDDHCQDIADQWAAGHQPAPASTVTPLPRAEQRPDVAA